MSKLFKKLTEQQTINALKEDISIEDTAKVEKNLIFGDFVQNLSENIDQKE